MDGIDGRGHYIALPPSVHLLEFPMDAIVEVKPAGPHAADANIARVAQDGIYRAADHERSLAEQANAHVRRFEAQRRAGIVERVEEGVWRVPQDLVSQGNRYDRKRQGGIAVKIQSYYRSGTSRGWSARRGSIVSSRGRRRRSQPWDSVRKSGKRWKRAWSSSLKEALRGGWDHD